MTALHSAGALHTTPERAALLAETGLPDLGDVHPRRAAVVVAVTTGMRWDALTWDVVRTVTAGLAPNNALAQYLRVIVDPLAGIAPQVCIPSGSFPVWEWSPDRSSVTVVDVVVPTDKGWRLHTGLADVLGWTAAETAIATVAPLRLYADPFEWIEAGGDASDAACVLDWETPLGHAIAHHLPGLIGYGAEHAAELHKITHPKPPKRPPVSFVRRPKSGPSA